MREQQVFQLVGEPHQRRCRLGTDQGGSGLRGERDEEIEMPRSAPRRRRPMRPDAPARTAASSPASGSAHAIGVDFRERLVDELDQEIQNLRRVDLASRTDRFGRVQASSRRRRPRAAAAAPAPARTGGRGSSRCTRAGSVAGAARSARRRSADETGRTAARRSPAPPARAAARPRARARGECRPGAGRSRPPPPRSAASAESRAARQRHARRRGRTASNCRSRPGSFDFRGSGTDSGGTG